MAAPVKTNQTVQNSEVMSLLDQVLARTPASSTRPNIALVEATLEEMAPHVEKLLPPKMKGQSEWLVARAANYFRSEDKLKDCPPKDFCRAVLKAAEMGLPLDGKLCYCVRYKAKYEALADYKGLISVAKSAGMIRDCKAMIHYENDKFRYITGTDGDRLEHEPEVRKPRGSIMGAYARFVMPDGTIRIDYMTAEDILKVQQFSPAKQDGHPVGPWAQWNEEMVKKCPVRRGLKFFIADPTMLRAMSADDVGSDFDEQLKIDAAGEPNPEPFSDEKPSLLYEQLKERLEAVIGQAKNRGILNKEKYYQLCETFGIPPGKGVVWSADQMMQVGDVVERMIAEADRDEVPLTGDELFPLPEDKTPAAHAEKR